MSWDPAPYREAAMRALDAQVELISWLRTSPIAERFHSAWQGINPQGLISLQERILDLAETYAVSGDVYDIIASGAALLPEVSLSAHDLPTPAGFIWLDESVVINDTQGRPTAIRAWAWSLAFSSPEEQRVYAIPTGAAAGKVPDCVQIWLYTDPTDERDNLATVLMEEGHTPHEAGLANLVLLNFGVMELGAVITTDPMRDQERWLFAFWRFVQEPWMDTRHIAPSRQAVRRAQRCHINGSAEVRVVRLRKTAERHSQPDDDNPQAWTHRWLVRGHWRNQYIPPRKDGTGERHELRWISPFVKGPEDMPLILKDRVFSVDR